MQDNPTEATQLYNIAGVMLRQHEGQLEASGWSLIMYTCTMSHASCNATDSSSTETCIQLHRLGTVGSFSPGEQGLAHRR